MFKKLLLSLLALTLISGCSQNSKKYSYTSEEFKNCFTVKEDLTTENWNKYFTIQEYTGEINDDSVELTEDTTKYYYYLTLKEDNKYIVSYDSTLTFSYDCVNTTSYLDSENNLVEEPQIATNPEERDVFLGTLPEMVIEKTLNTYTSEEFDWYTEDGSYVLAHQETTFDIDNFRATSAKGTVYTIDIPENKWFTSEDGRKYISVVFEDTGTSLYLYEDGIIECYDAENVFQTSTGDGSAHIDSRFPQLIPNQNEVTSNNWAMIEHFYKY